VMFLLLFLPNKFGGPRRLEMAYEQTPARTYALIWSYSWAGIVEIKCAIYSGVVGGRKEAIELAIGVLTE
jgi:hypothetical protein